MFGIYRHPLLSRIEKQEILTRDESAIKSLLTFCYCQLSEVCQEVSRNVTHAESQRKY